MDRKNLEDILYTPDNWFERAFAGDNAFECIYRMLAVLWANSMNETRRSILMNSMFSNCHYYDTIINFKEFIRIFPATDPDRVIVEAMIRMRSVETFWTPEKRKSFRIAYFLRLINDANAAIDEENTKLRNPERANSLEFKSRRSRK